MNRQPRARDRNNRAPDPIPDPPLPPATVTAWRAHQGQHPQNPSLVFDRFAPDWGRQSSLKKVGLEVAVQAAQSADPQLLTAWNTRWAEVTAAAGAEPFSLRTDWRFLTGLGAHGPLEVGFTFHRYGFPILPGSSVKGVARAYGLLDVADALEEAALAALVETEKDAGPLAALDRRILSVGDQENHRSALRQLLPTATEEATALIAHFRRIFGTTESAGNAVFFDAIPTTPPKLDLDIMNPHYPDYYRDSRSKTAPTDWQSPIPVYFLTVSPSTAFCFAVGWRGTLENDAAHLRDLARDWLTAGLKELGAGAKTSAGYGYFTDRLETHTPSETVAANVSAGRASHDRGQGTEAGSGGMPLPPTGPRIRVTNAPEKPTRPPSPPRTMSRAPSPVVEGLPWRVGTVIEFRSQIARGELVDESGPHHRFTRDTFDDRSWTPGRGAKVQYMLEEQEGTSRVVRVRRMEDGGQA